MAVAVKADHSRADAGKHGLGEAPPRIDLVAGFHNLGALRVELRGHAIEGKTERCDFVIVAIDIDLRLQIAFGNALGSADQSRDRLDDSIGRPQSHPDRGEQNQRRHHDVKHREDKLHFGAVPIEAVIFRGRIDGALVIAQHFGIDAAHHQQIGVVQRLHADQRAHHADIGIGVDDDGAFGGLLDIGDRGQFQIGQESLLGRAQNARFRIQNVGGLQATLFRQFGKPREQHFGARVVLLVEQLRIVLDGIGDFVGVGHDQPLMALHIAFGDIDRILQCGLHARGEPRLDAEVQRHRREQRHENRRHHRDGREHRHQPHMQPRARKARTPVRP